MPRSTRRTHLLFGALTFYVVVQFLWWAVLLVRKEKAMAALAQQVEALGGTTDHAPDASRALRMIAGEGIVFLVLLLGMIALTFRSIRRELAAARTQRNFLLAVTHELRTPIAAIKLQLQTFKRAGLSQEQRDGLHQQALSEADRLSALTDKVLLATSAEEGILPLDLTELDVMEVLRNVAERARAQVASHHHIVLNGPARLVVRSDAQALRSIADNLIENAAKYAPQGTRITIDVAEGPEGWRMAVTDEGPGVPPEEQARIFERFHRGGNEETRKTKGTGLGLYIVRNLVQRLGGEVLVSRAATGGAIFAASFPHR